jgi:hypothetical protein
VSLARALVVRAAPFHVPFPVTLWSHLMSFAARSLLSCLLLGLVTQAAWSQEPAKPGKKPAAAPGSYLFNLPKEVTLTAEQQAKLDAIKTEYGPRATSAQKKLDGILSGDQLKARKAAQDKAKAEKLTGKAQQALIDEALQLTPEQKTSYGAATEELRALQTEIRGKLAEFLTEEQKAKVPFLAKKPKAK